MGGHFSIYVSWAQPRKSLNILHFDNFFGRQQWTVSLWFLSVPFLWVFVWTCNAFAWFTNWDVFPSVFFITWSWANTWPTLPQYKETGYKSSGILLSLWSLGGRVLSRFCWQLLYQWIMRAPAKPILYISLTYYHDQCLLSIFHLLSWMTAMQTGTQGMQKSPFHEKATS